MNFKENTIEASNSPKIPRVDIVLEDYWDTISRNEEFITKLKEQKLYNPNHMYTGFKGFRAATQGSVYAVGEAMLSGDDLTNPLEYAIEHEGIGPSMISVYDRNYMAPAEDVNQFKITDPKALVYIIKIDNRVG